MMRNHIIVQPRKNCNALGIYWDPMTPYPQECVHDPSRQPSPSIDLLVVVEI